MAGHEAGLGDQVAGAQRSGPEAQVGNGNGAGFFRIVNEIALRVVVGFLANDLDRILVGADGSIRAQSEEERAHRAGDFGRKLGIVIQASMSDVVVNANCKVILYVRLRELVENTLHHRRRKLFRCKSVAPADHLLLYIHFD